MLDAHVVKSRPQFVVNVHVRVPTGERCAIFGVSGAGKSTLLACIAGAERQDGGRVELDGVMLYPPPLPLHLRSLGYLTQDANLFPHLTVAENVRFGLQSANDGAHAAWISELRARLELGSIWREPAWSTSGGQARRVALARMLARKPTLVLLDEPFAGLDRHLVRELLVAIVDWQTALGFTLLVVDHESDVLDRLCTRVVALGEGRVIQDTTWPNLRLNPATPVLAKLIAPL